MEGPRSQEKWSNFAVSRVIAIQDILQTLGEIGPLPEGKEVNARSIAADPKNPLRIGNNMMDYAERVLADSTFRSSLSPNGKGLLKKLSDLVEGSR